MENPEIPSATPDDTDSLLREFDSSVSADRDAGVNKPNVDLSRPMTFEERIAAGIAERDRRLADARQSKRDEVREAERNELASLRQWAEGIEAERMAERERAEAEVVFAQAGEAVAELAPWLPPDYARRWVENEARTDGTLGEAWQRRHESEEWAGIAQRQVDRAIRRFAKHLEALPEPTVSGDREAVTAAVRGSGGPPPPPPAPSYNSKSDLEFADTVERNFGFRPL